jgi:hypothetical protein
MLGGVLDAADLRRRDNVTGDANDKQLTEAEIENNLNRNPRIGTAENDGEGACPGINLFRREGLANVPTSWPPHTNRELPSRN